MAPGNRGQFSVKMAADGNGTNIIKYSKISRINVGIIIFLFIFVELIVAVIDYANTKHVSPYEVKAGSLYSNSLYTGIALRDEQVITGTNDGYVNYYVREGQHVAVGDLIYTIDETGRLSEAASDSNIENSLSDSDLSRLRTEISGFSSSFNNKEFSQVYTFKNSLNSRVVELANYDILDSINNISDFNSSLVHYCYAQNPGIVTYNIDGYETLKLEDMTSDYFDQANYEYNQLASNSLVASGDNIYKICTNEDWMLVIQVDAETAATLVEKEYVEVKFSRNQYTSWGAVSQYIDPDGNYYIGLSFTNSMITFCVDRFINIELLLDNESGLKIPASSIVKKDFYIVPKEYVTIGSDGKHGVMKNSFDDEGNPTVEFIETPIYSETDTEYYLDTSELRTGDIIRLPNSETEESYTIRLTDSLDGVYNINKGYAEFREIIILYNNDDYYIVKPNTTYGLSVYDYIVLDASTVSDNEMIYE